MRATAVLLASGGLDSTVLSYWLVDHGIDFIPLFLDYGQHCAVTERETLLEVLPSDYVEMTAVIRLGDIYKACHSRLIVPADLWKEKISADDLYLPYRNLLFLAAGAAFAQARDASVVYAAFINSNHAKEIDCSAEFFGRLSGLLADYGSVRVEMPFRTMSKLEVARVGLRLGAPLGRTFSCQAATRTACGACPNCVDRLEALRRLEERE